jgi:Ca2+-binding EF-hand superfamily protein
MDSSLFMREEYLRATFKMFDKDNSGKIDASEVV